MALAQGQYNESYEHFMSALKTEPDNSAVSSPLHFFKTGNKFSGFLNFRRLERFV